MSEWLDPFITETVQQIRRSSDELWDYFLSQTDGDFEEFRQHKESFGKSALYAAVALGLDMPSISDELSDLIGVSSPKTPTGKHELLKSDKKWMKDLGKMLDVSDRIVAEWDAAGRMTGGYDQGATRTYENVSRLIKNIKRGPIVEQARQQIAKEEPVQPQQSLLSPEMMGGQNG